MFDGQAPDIDVIADCCNDVVLFQLVNGEAL